MHLKTLSSMLKALSIQPGWKYLNREGDVALLAAHYWRISLGLGRINERVICRLWEMPATALKKLTGYQKLSMSVLIEMVGSDLEMRGRIAQLRR